MPQSTISQSNRLATRIKTKYPGQYDDLDDDDLEKRMVTKFPGEYDDLVYKPEPTKKTGAWNRIKEIGSSLYESMPITQMKRAGQNLAKMETDSAYKKQQEDYFKSGQAEQEWKDSISIPRVAEAAIFPGAPITGTYDVAKSTLEDIKTGNLGGAGVNLALAGAGAYGGYRALRGPKAATPKVTVVPDVEPIPPIEPPRVTPQLTEFAGVDPRTLAGQAETIARRGPAQRLLGAYNPPEIEPTNRFISHPSGKVANAFDPSSAEALDSLTLKRPGTTNPLPVDTGAVTLPPVQPVKPWDFDAPGINKGPESYSLPRSQGVQAVSPGGRGALPKGEVSGRVPPKVKTRKIITKTVDPETGKIVRTSRRVPISDNPDVQEALRLKKISGESADYSDPLQVTVPDRLRAEVPNVTRLRGMAEGYPKQGDLPPVEPVNIINEADWENSRWGKEGKTVTVGEGLDKKVKNPSLKLKEELLPSSPPKGSIDRFKPVVEPVKEPTPRAPFKSGDKVKDPNLIERVGFRGKGFKEILQEADELAKTKAAKVEQALEKERIRSAKVEEANMRSVEKQTRQAAERAEKYNQTQEAVKLRGEADALKYRLETAEKQRKAEAAAKKTADSIAARERKMTEKQTKAAERYEERAAKEAVKSEKRIKADEQKLREENAEFARQKSEKHQKFLDEREAAIQAIKDKKPTIKNALKMARNAIRGSSGYQSTYEKVGVSGETQLNRLGKGGKRLAKLMKNEATASNVLAGEHKVLTRQARRNLSKAEQAEVVELLDGTKAAKDVSNAKVSEWYATLRNSLNRLAEGAKKAGVKMKTHDGRIIDFQEHKGEYFPRFYDPALFKDLESLEQQLLKAGNSPVKVEAMMKNIREKGARFHPGQHTRDFNLPEGYDKTFEALDKYYENMSEAITRAERYGALDVADDNSAISRMIRGTANPEKAKKIVMQYLGRDASGDIADLETYGKTTKAVAATKLSLQAITNLIDIAGSASNIGIKSTGKAILDVMKDRQGMADYATKVGALNLDKASILREAGGKKFGGYFGTNATEKLVRTIEAVAGEKEVKSLFEKAKADPKWKRSLQRYLEDDVDEVLKQDKLTTKQTEFASGRAAEMVSGVPNRLSLSEAFYSKNPMLRLPLLLKRFAFLNTKNMVDAVKAQPDLASKVKKAATILAAYNVMGEATADTKEAIKGLVTGDIDKHISERGENEVGSGNEAFDRLMANWLRASVFGLPGDVAESVYRKSRGKFTSTVLGPVGSDLDEFAQIFGSDNKLKAAGKFGAKRIPFVGAGLAEKFFPDEKKKGSKFSSSLSSGF